MEPTRPARCLALARYYSWLAGRLISRPLGSSITVTSGRAKWSSDIACAGSRGLFLHGCEAGTTARVCGGVPSTGTITSSNVCDARSRSLFLHACEAGGAHRGEPSGTVPSTGAISSHDVSSARSRGLFLHAGEVGGAHQGVIPTAPSTGANGTTPMCSPTREPL